MKEKLPRARTLHVGSAFGLKVFIVLLNEIYYCTETNALFPGFAHPHMQCVGYGRWSSVRPIFGSVMESGR